MPQCNYRPTPPQFQPPQPPQPPQPFQSQYQPRNRYMPNYSSSYKPQSFFGYSEPQYYDDRPQVFIPGISHGELRPVLPNINSSQMNMNNGYSSQMSNLPNNTVNRSTLGPQKRPIDEKPVVPDMLVTCQFCMCPQNIPGNSTIYICYSCQRRVKCFPTHNIFKCAGCNKRVCYQLGTSHLIKCGHCKTVN
jgi:hypothetical protein